ncbi:hypothetical protein GCM10009037_31220 [Halarchaeum grantii]|uniref:Uncharacterized protein n=1 Tax=Halarchaeum grantii TaxID=1193105 RepID=A0A830F744_9EURY|nr:hypothetical protein GCM10009037_31220 [Halarchaeum grantii]
MRFEGVKYPRVFGRNAHVVPDHDAFDGSKYPRTKHSGPEGMRILPLRSAVQMGSDVSLDGQ